MNYPYLTLLLSFIFLTGCKIEIKVPEGGYIEGWGLHGCGEAQTCIIDVNHLWFYDIFSAVPNSTHEFKGWKNAQDYLCGGSQKDCKLTTFDFANSSLKSLLSNDDKTFYLEPIFEPRYANYQNRIDENLKITVYITQENYPVDASTHSSWFDSIQSDKNPLYIGDDGLKITGYANWRSEKSYYYFKYSAGQCHITSYGKTYHQITILPAPTIPQILGVEAEEAYWDIVLHEGGHHRIYRWLFDRRVQRISELFHRRRIPGVNSVQACNDYLYEELAQIQDETYEQHNLEGQEFHGYDRGWTWGVCDDIPNRFMNIYCPTEMQ